MDTPVDYTEEYTYVSVTNATLEDGFSSGIYKVGQSIVVTPDLGFGVSAGAVGFVDNGDGTFTYEVPEEKPDLSGAFEDKSSSIDPAVKIADVVEALTLNFTAMKVGDEQTLPAFIAEVWEDEVSISWSIADDSIAVGSIEDNVLSFTEAGDATLVATIACEGAESVEVTFGINVDDSDETKLNNALAALNLDFTEVELGAEKTLPTSISGHEVTVAWEVSNATLSDDNTVTFNATGTAILTAKITYNKISVHKPFEITVTGAVSAEQAYFLFGESGGKTYYVAGTGNQRLTATTNMDEALAIYFEYDSGDNYYIYFKEGEAKTYIGHSSSTNLTFGEKAAATTWTMDTIEEKFMSTASGATDRWLGINTSTSPVCVRPYNTDTYKPVYFMEAKELTPEYKIDQEIAALQTEYSINGGEKVNLPVKGETYKDVTISWELVGNYDFVESLVDGELVTTNPSEDATVTLKATLKCGEESKIFEGIVVTVKYVNASVPAEPIGAKTYTFSSYPNGTQYAQGEKHALDSDVTLTINGAHLNGEVRLYAGSNAVLSIPSANKVFAGTFTVNAGNKAGTLTISASVDGTTWVKLDAVTTTSSYKDYSVTVDQAAGYKYLKMESAGAQIRVKNVKFA